MGLKETNRIKFGLIFGLLLIFIVAPALAEIQEGYLGTLGSMNTTNFGMAAASYFACPPSCANITAMKFENIENSQNPYSIVSYIKTSYATFPKTSDYIDVILYSGNTPVGSGGLGYNKNSVTGFYQVYFIFNTWNPTGLTGTQFINFTPTSSSMIWNGLGETVGFATAQTLGANSVGFSTAGQVLHLQSVIGIGEAPLIYNKLTPFMNYYRIETNNMSITQVNVSKLYNGYNYTSKVYVLSRNNIITNEPAFQYATNYSGFFTDTAISISILDSYTRWWNTTASIISQNFSLSVIPSNISLNGYTYGSISSPSNPLLNSITAINWQYYVTSPNSDLYDFYENGDNVNGINYILNGSSWYGWNTLLKDFTNNKGTVFPNPVILYPQSGGNLSIFVTVYTADGGYYTLTAPLQVSVTGNLKTIILEAADWQSGMLISPVNWSVKNLLTNTWSNKTSTSGDGTWTIQYSAGVTLYVEANAYGYAKGTLTKQVPNGNDIWILQLYPLSVVSGNITNSTLLVKVMGDNNDGKFQPLNNVAVTLSDNQYQLTASLGGVAGQAQFTVKNDTIYSISGKKDKYVSVTKTVFVTGDIYTATLFMSPLAGSTVIPTTATPRPTATPTVTLSGYQPAYGNFTGFWAPFENMGVAMGAQPNEVGVLMMFMLIIGFLILGGWAAGPLGAEVGVVTGMVCSVAFGFLPRAISIAVIAVLVLYGALRIWGVTR